MNLIPFILIPLFRIALCDNKMPEATFDRPMETDEPQFHMGSGSLKDDEGDASSNAGIDKSIGEMMYDDNHKDNSNSSSENNNEDAYDLSIDDDEMNESNGDGPKINNVTSEEHSSIHDDENANNSSNNTDIPRHTNALQDIKEHNQLIPVDMRLRSFLNKAHLACIEHKRDQIDAYIMYNGQVASKLTEVCQNLTSAFSPNVCESVTQSYGAFKPYISKLNAQISAKSGTITITCNSGEPASVLCTQHNLIPIGGPSVHRHGVKIQRSKVDSKPALTLFNGPLSNKSGKTKIDVCRDNCQNIDGMELRLALEKESYLWCKYIKPVRNTPKILQVTGRNIEDEAHSRNLHKI